MLCEFHLNFQKANRVSLNINDITRRTSNPNFCQLLTVQITITSTWIINYSIKEHTETLYVVLEKSHVHCITNKILNFYPVLGIWWIKFAKFSENST